MTLGLMRLGIHSIPIGHQWISDLADAWLRFESHLHVSCDAIADPAEARTRLQPNSRDIITEC